MSPSRRTGNGPARRGLRRRVEVIRRAYTRGAVSGYFKEVGFEVGELVNRIAAGVSLACLLSIACTCSPHARSNVGRADADARAQAPASTGTTAAHADTHVGGLSFNLVNFTGSTLRAVYVSPSESGGWEENVLGGDGLNDGDTLGIRFSPEESAALWDIRVESADEHCAEWKGIDLRGVSRITLLLKLAGEPVAVAEVE